MNPRSFRTALSLVVLSSLGAGVGCRAIVGLSDRSARDDDGVAGPDAGADGEATASDARAPGDGAAPDGADGEGGDGGGRDAGPDAPIVDDDGGVLTETCRIMKQTCPADRPYCTVNNDEGEQKFECAAQPGPGALLATGVYCGDGLATYLDWGTSAPSGYVCLPVCQTHEDCKDPRFPFCTANLPFPSTSPYRVGVCTGCDPNATSDNGEDCNVTTQRCSIKALTQRTVCETIAPTPAPRGASCARSSDCAVALHCMCNFKPDGGVATGVGDACAAAGDGKCLPVCRPWSAEATDPSGDECVTRFAGTRCRKINDTSPTYAYCE